MEDNKDENTLPTGENNPGELKNIPVKQQDKSASGMKIVGINIGVLAIYTVLCSIGGDEGGFIFDAFLIFVHVVVCIIVALAKRNWMWFLSALLVLAIGFSTCVSFGSLGSIH